MTRKASNCLRALQRSRLAGFAVGCHVGELELNGTKPTMGSPCAKKFMKRVSIPAPDQQRSLGGSDES